MFDCGFYTNPSHKTVLCERIRNNTDSHIKVNENNTTSIKSYTLSYEKSDKNDELIFIPNNILFILNPNEDRFKYGYFAFMMVRILENEDEKKNDAIIGYSQNPFFSTFYRNKQSVKEKIKCNGKEWQLYIILGPFILKKTCINCCTDWLMKTRGINSKKNRADKLKIDYNTDLYSSNKLEKEELDKLVIETLPDTFITEYEKLYK
jgi:hypothetical protein